MSRIKGKDTTAEMIVRRYLFKQGFRYRLHGKELPGKPDIVLPKHKIIIDVRGCFWHGHENCKYGDEVKTNSEVISKRIIDAKLRDIRNEKQWQKLGWRFFVVWDRCQLEDKRKHSELRETTLASLKDYILEK